ncbi:U2 small nuclear ribonucleoprotein A'-like [Hordeum vulgare]|nr:U2 small nuclear ribonucleoprotein A'-like [Hordeum vulgare]
MVRLNADLIWKILHFFNAIMERELDLRGNKIVIIENIGTTKVTFATCPSFSLDFLGAPSQVNSAVVEVAGEVRRGKAVVAFSS